MVISREYVRSGKGSVLAYVPTVQIQDGLSGSHNLRVDTFNREPVYAVGQQLEVSCNLERGCIEDSFIAKWGASLINLLVSLLFFSPLLAWKFGLWQPNSEITRLNLQGEA